MGERPLLLTVPNFSVGEPGAGVDAVTAALIGGGLRLLDVHLDPDHGRSVLTLAGRQGDVAASLASAAATAAERIDLTRHRGLHPHVGALDVAPVVYLAPGDRGAAVAEALTAAALMGEQGLPVFLYGDLATGDDRRERAALRAGGPARLAERMAAGELRPDYGPRRPHATAGAVLATARPPLVAVNVDLDTDDLDLARAIDGGDLRESGGGPAGVRAIGLYLPGRRRAQVSMNLHDLCRAAPVAELVRRVRARGAGAELEVGGLVPQAALDGLGELDVPLRDFDRRRRVIEEVLAAPG